MDFVLIDDVTTHRKILADQLKLLCDKLHLSCRIALETEHWQEVVRYAESARPNTVYFLDIELEGEVDGIAICRMIHEKQAKAYVIYASAYQKYALECCKSHAFDFLLKPWTDEQLLDCLKAIVRDIEFEETGNKLLVELGTRTIKLNQDDILYFSKDRTVVTAVCQSGHSFSWRESFVSLLPRLREGVFFQCYKSYIINLKKVREYLWSEDALILENDERIPVSRRRVAQLRAAAGAKG